tara:strand:+ start:275 stop:466 length:192 start_codon:yes stop_codon:yes gene_type:complete
MDKNQSLSASQTKMLRDQNLISENEYAYCAGDLIIAENALSGEKRIVGQAVMLSESHRRVLKV